MEPRILRLDRLRRVPAHFSWVDHRLVRNKHMQYCETKAWAMYLFLVTVGNAQGVSWYSDTSMAKLMNVPECVLFESRAFLHPGATWRKADEKGSKIFFVSVWV